MVSSIVATSINDFISYALTLVGIMIGYYVIKFFIVAGPPGKTKSEVEEDLTARRKAVKKFIDEKKEKGEGKKKVQKKKAAKGKRRKKFSPVLGLVTKSINVTEKAIVALNQGKQSEAESHAKDLKKNVRHVWRELRSLRDEVEGDTRSELDNLVAGAQRIFGEIKVEVLDKIKATDWKTKVNEIDTKLTEYKGSCGAIFNGVTDIINTE